MVHKGMSKHYWNLGSLIPWTVYHYILTRNGNCTVDCKFLNLSIEVQKQQCRNCCSRKLDIKSDSEPDIFNITEALGSAGTFLLFAGFSSIGLVAIFILVPETKGMQFEEVEKLLQKGYSPFRKQNSDDDENTK
ncbi:unnamed protein product [Fraxinus pennsylvanica]|uniref:Uncharacterized protein n=1 Tax=Fraxinus pennsylvanica TaxID=56036 RepID=A0AAD1ZA69_9LAMI|nr:unnamed protein product [Fraxinus pennsylvanica]